MRALKFTTVFLVVMGVLMCIGYRRTAIACNSLDQGLRAEQQRHGVQRQLNGRRHPVQGAVRRAEPH